VAVDSASLRRKVQKVGYHCPVLCPQVQALTLLPWIQKQHVSLKPWYLSTTLHSVTSQEAMIFPDTPS